MVVRLILALALLLSTMPAPSTAAPACHEAPMAETMAGMDHDAPAPAPEKPRKPGKALCVGCIAPTTMKGARLAVPVLADAGHGKPPALPDAAGALLTPEPPPPRG